MNMRSIRRPVPLASAITVAMGLHIGLAMGMLLMPQASFVPPQTAGGFEIVDLSAFGVAAQPEPEPIEETPVEDKPVEEVLQKPEPEPDIVPNEPEPVAIAKPKPQPKPKPEAKPISKPQPQLQPKPKPQPQTATAGSQSAYVPSSSTAAYLRNPKPSYPALAQRRGMEGVVLLLVDVSIDGKPLSVKVKKGSGYSILDKAAVKAVQAWRFTPARRGARAVQAKVEVPIRFLLNDV